MFVWIMLEVTAIMWVILDLLKVTILIWNNVLGYATITNIFGVCLKGLIFFMVNSRC